MSLSRETSDVKFFFLLLSGHCPHQSIPVEMDESMTASGLDLAWPAFCKQCSGHTETSKRPQEHAYEEVRVAQHSVGQWRLPENQQQQHEPRAAPQPCFILPTQPRQTDPAGVWPPDFRKQALLYEQDLRHRSFAGPSDWPQHHSVEEPESLEPPCTLKSENLYTLCVPPRLPAARMPGQCQCCIIIIRNMETGVSVVAISEMISYQSDDNTIFGGSGQYFGCSVAPKDIYQW